MVNNIELYMYNIETSEPKYKRRNFITMLIYISDIKYYLKT